MSSSIAGLHGRVTLRNPDAHFGSARSTLLTVFSVFTFRTPHAAPTSAFQYALKLIGFEPNTTRQALNRAAGSGLIESIHDGRRALWQLTSAGHTFMVEGSRRIAALNDHRTDWDGQFVMLAAPVAERDRALRRILRSRLTWAGFGSPYPGMWISPHLSAERAAAKVIADLGLDSAESFVVRAGAIGNIEEVVRRSWDLNGLAANYQIFIDEVSAMRPGAGDESLVALVKLIHLWRRFPFMDPALPASLLPPTWVGADAAEVFDSRQALWRPPAERRWQELVHDVS